MNIGPFRLSRPFCQAGLAGYSDRAMRLVARRRGCPYAVTEALLDVILLSGGQGLKKSIDINDEDHPVAGQIIGSDADTMSRSAAILAERGYDVIDLNFACPVKKIKNKARGGHMLQDLPRAVDILKSVRDTVPANVPTTVSLRRGFNDSAESEDRFHRIMETAIELGYAAMRVHARTVEQKYQGRAKWPFLRQIKQQYPHAKILGSGDVFTAEDVVAMLRETGVDAVWIARGAIGNPWIFQHAAALLEMGTHHNDTGLRPVNTTSICSCDACVALDRRSSEEPTRASQLQTSTTDPRPVSRLQPPTIADQRAALVEHFAIAMQIHGESLAGRRMRKMGIKYSRFHPDCTEVKRDFIEVHSLRDWTRVLDKWYAEDAPGVWPAADAADEVNSEESGCAVA
jgi:nifR3 family TIM-barrel protein